MLFIKTDDAQSINQLSLAAPAVLFASGPPFGIFFAQRLHRVLHRTPRNRLYGARQGTAGRPLGLSKPTCRGLLPPVVVGYCAGDGASWLPRCGSPPDLLVRVVHQRPDFIFCCAF